VKDNNTEAFVSKRKHVGKEGVIGQIFTGNLGGL